MRTVECKKVDNKKEILLERTKPDHAVFFKKMYTSF